MVAVVGLRLVGPDVLGYPASLLRGDCGLSNIVKQAGLAVVDVPHDRNDW